MNDSERQCDDAERRRSYDQRRRRYGVATGHPGARRMPATPIRAPLWCPRPNRSARARMTSVFFALFASVHDCSQRADGPRSGWPSGDDAQDRGRSLRHSDHSPTHPTASGASARRRWRRWREAEVTFQECSVVQRTGSRLLLCHGLRTRHRQGCDKRDKAQKRPLSRLHLGSLK